MHLSQALPYLSLVGNFNASQTPKGIYSFRTLGIAKERVLESNQSQGRY